MAKYTKKDIIQMVEDDDVENIVKWGLKISAAIFMAIIGYL